MSDDRANDPDRFVFYRYTVSIPAAAIFVALFTATTAFHCYQLQRTKRWNMIPLIIGGLMQIGGYAARIGSHFDQWDLAPYIAQTLLLLVAPVLFAATIYMTLSGIIITAIATNLANENAESSSSSTVGFRQKDADNNTLSNNNAPPAIVKNDTGRPTFTDEEMEAARKARVLKVPVVWITRIFVTADVVALVTQGGGGGIMAGGSEEKMKLGENIVLAGLWIQIVAFVFFLSVAIVFDLRQRKVEKAAHSEGKNGGWRKMLNVMYGASSLVLVRNLFRVIEYIQGNSGYLLRNEVWLYIFDALLMFVLMVLFNLSHPGRVLVAEGHVGGRAKRDEEMELENKPTGEGWNQTN